MTPIHNSLELKSNLQLPQNENKFLFEHLQFYITLNTLCNLGLRMYA